MHKSEASGGQCCGAAEMLLKNIFVCFFLSVYLSTLLCRSILQNLNFLFKVDVKRCQILVNVNCFIINSTWS